MGATILQFMSNDHDRLDRLFEKFRKLMTDDASEARALFGNFKAGLETHIAWEEDILFPIFERETGMHDAGPTAMMRMEHGHIKQFLDEIGKNDLAGELKSTDDVETSLSEILRSHNQKEEHILYSAIDTLFSEQEKERAISRMTEMLPGASA